jgi:hypothetical protein
MVSGWLLTRVRQPPRLTPLCGALVKQRALQDTVGRGQTIAMFGLHVLAVCAFLCAWR